MKKFVSISGMCLIMCLFLTGCGNNQKPVSQVKEEPTGQQLVQRGEYLLAMSGCSDCHSPKTMGPQGPQVISERFLSGHPSDETMPKFDPSLIKTGLVLFNGSLTLSAGMWGISYSANLTPDQTGIGNWTEDNFKRALKEGKYKGLEGSRTLLPPMPWQNFSKIEDKDVTALFAYLKSLKPVNNVVPLPVPPDQIK